MIKSKERLIQHGESIRKGQRRRTFYNMPFSKNDYMNVFEYLFKKEYRTNTRQGDLVTSRQALLFFVFQYHLEKCQTYNECAQALNEAIGVDRTLVFHSAKRCYNALTGYDPILKRKLIKVYSYFGRTLPKIGEIEPIIKNRSIKVTP